MLDQKPLQYARAIGLDPAQVAGRAETQVRFKLPLLNDLKLETVDYSANATIVGAKTGKVVLDREMTDGNFTLDLARTGARLKRDRPVRQRPGKARGRPSSSIRRAGRTPCTGSG